MKFVFLFAFSALATLCSGSPVDDGQLEHFDEEHLKLIEGDLAEMGEELARNKRATRNQICHRNCEVRGFTTGSFKRGICKCKHYHV